MTLTVTSNRLHGCCAAGSCLGVIVVGRGNTACCNHHTLVNNVADACPIRIARIIKAVFNLTQGSSHGTIYECTRLTINRRIVSVAKEGVIKDVHLLWSLPSVGIVCGLLCSQVGIDAVHDDSETRNLRGPAGCRCGVEVLSGEGHVVPFLTIELQCTLLGHVGAGIEIGEFHLRIALCGLVSDFLVSLSLL